MLARDNKAQAVRDQDVNISRQLEVKSDFFQSLDLTMTTSLGGERNPMGKTRTWGLETISHHWPG